MRVLKIVVLVLVVLVAGVLMLASTKPDTFKVERSASIQAPPEKVFALLNDFKAWGGWSPWEHKDPAMKRSFGTLTSGVGATYAWEGNSEVGQGSMEIVLAVPAKRMVLKLDFIAPFEAHNIVDFTLSAEGGATTVNWSMEGPANFMTKVMHVFFDMDAMVGKDFEAGLASLKALAEKP